MIHHNVFRCVLGLGLLLFVSALVNAQVARTWVSGVGDDANPCSRTAPCKTFAGAISKTATNGEINCIDPGGFGSVTITKSITLDCTGTFGSILSSMTTGVIVNITNTADTKKAVRLRGLQIDGAGTGTTGIRVIAANSVSIENVVIDGVIKYGVSVESATQVVVRNSTIRATDTAIYAVKESGSPEITVAGSLITFNGTGVEAGPDTTIQISGNVITYNKVGLAAKGKITSFGNNAIYGNTNNGTATSTVPQQ